MKNVLCLFLMMKIHIQIVTQVAMASSHVDVLSTIDEYENELDLFVLCYCTLIWYLKYEHGKLT